MHFHQNALAAMGGDSFPSEDDKTLGGVTKTIIGGPAVRGQIVRAATDDESPLLNAGAAAGDRSIGVTAQVLDPADAPVYAQVAEYFIALEDVTVDSEGRFLDFGVCPALANVPAGGFEARVPLMPDFATGTLVPWDGTAKAVAVTNVKIPPPDAPRVMLIPARFRGLDGWS